MLVAYEDLGFQVKDLSEQELKFAFHPISSRGEAQRIQREASRRRPDIRWTIVGEGPFSVREQSPVTATVKTVDRT
jgi:hypothetical protein